MTIDQMLALKPGHRVTDARQDGRLLVPCTASHWLHENGNRIGLALTPDDQRHPPCYVLHGVSVVTLKIIAGRLTILRTGPQEKR